MRPLIPVALLGIIIILVHFSLAKPKFRIRYAAYGSVVVLAILALIYDAYPRDTGTGNPNHWLITTFLGPIIVALGWIVTNEISLNNSRKQHTIKLVTDLMNNERHIQDRKIINEKLPPYGRPITPDMVDYENATDELIPAIDRELNFYEFIAVGLDAGDLDPVIAERFLVVAVPTFVTQMHGYIRHWQAKDERIWKYLIDLANKWSQA